MSLHDLTPLLVGAFTIAAAGCSSDQGEISEDEYPGRYADAVCGSMEPCCRDNGLAFDHGNCVLGGAGFVQAGVDQARKVGAVFDAQAADDCITGAARLARACSRTEDDAAVSAACSRVWSGTKKPGAPCSGDLECAPGPGGRGSCYGARLDGSAQGVCVVLTSPAKVDDVCGVASGPPPATLADCRSSELQCDFGSRTCQPLTPIGAACPGFTTCVKSAHCDAAGTCSTKLAVDVPCSADGECSSGACISGACGKNGVGTPTPCTGADK